MLTPDEVRIIVRVCGGDGHSIKKVSAFAGVNPAFLKTITRSYESDRSSPKSTIYGNEGEVLDKVEGVYTLDALYAVCHDLTLSTASVTAMGRGFQARQVTEVITNYLSTI